MAGWIPELGLVGGGAEGSGPTWSSDLYCGSVPRYTGRSVRTWMPRTEALPLVIKLQAAVFRPHQQLDLPITPACIFALPWNILQIISSAYLFVSELQALSCGLALDDTAGHDPGVIGNPS